MRNLRVYRNEALDRCQHPSNAKKQLPMPLLYLKSSGRMPALLIASAIVESALPPSFGRYS